MSVEVALIVSIVSVAFSIFFGLKNNKRSDTKDIEERVKDNTRINMKLDSIYESTDEIKKQLTSLVDKVQAHENRLALVEAGIKRNDNAIKRLHERIDSIGKRPSKEEKIERWTLVRSEPF